jgi:transcription antitermination factor NusG
MNSSHFWDFSRRRLVVGYCFVRHVVSTKSIKVVFTVSELTKYYMAHLKITNLSAISRDNILKETDYGQRIRPDKYKMKTSQ